MCHVSRVSISIVCLFVAPHAFAADAQSGDTVAITGSLIPRSDRTTTAPVTVLDREYLENSGLVSVGDILQDLPSQLNAINTQFNNGGDGSTRVDLRGLGSARTVVLLNGRRVVAGGTGADASVDLNLIPLAMVSRIEVLKRGASAEYGSGAIGGVVNIITRDDVRGVEGDALVGTSGESDGTSYGLSLLFGDGDDAGGFVLGASYERQEKVWARDRDFSEFDKFYDYDLQQSFPSGSSAVPNGYLRRFDDEFDPGNALYQSEVAANCPSGVCTRDSTAGGWRDFNFDQDLYNFQTSNYLITPSERYGVFGSGHKDLGGIRLFGEFSYARRESAERLAPTPLFEFQNIISRDSIYNPYGLDLFFRRRLVEAGDRAFDQEVDMARAVVGLGGDLPSANDWTWEVSFNYGQTSADQTDDGNIILSRLNDGTGPSFIDEGGTPRCGVQGPAPGPADDDVISGCVPVNLLGLPGSLTPAMLGYIGYQGKSHGENEEYVASARFTGRILETPWQGHLSATLGVDVRHVSGEFTPDDVSASGDSSGNTTFSLDGSYDVNEGYAELSFVPLTDRGWVRSLEFDGAVRAYDGDSSISGTAWDAGFLLSTASGLSLRGQYSSAYRLPAIGELFSAQSITFPFGPDPCDAFFGALDDPNVAARCAAEGLPPTFESEFAFFTPALSGGNPDLHEETANTYTVGFLFEPTAASGFSLSVDYFHLSLKHGITSIFADLVFTNCYFNPDPQRRNCDLVSRDPVTGFIDFVDTRLGNYGETRSSGYDAAVTYSHDFGSPGRLTLAVDVTYLENFEQDLAGFVTEGVGVYDLGVYPRLKTQSSLRWDRGALGLGVNVRSIAGFTECESFACGDPFVRENLSRHVSDNWTTDVQATYRLETSLGKSTLRVGANNVFNEAPAAIYDGFLADSDASTYDYMGRFFYVGLTHQY